MTKALPPIASDIIARLKRELPSHLVYHTPEHTEDVVRDALMLAHEEQLSERETELLMIAAAFHDAGFLERPDDNESLGGEAAQAAMRECGGYSAEEMNQVCDAILTTRRETVPRSRFGACLVDADVANFGRADCLEKTELVWTEQGKPERGAFDRAVVALMSEHRWYTPTAQRLWGDQKTVNLEVLRGRIR